MQQLKWESKILTESKTAFSWCEFVCTLKDSVIDPILWWMCKCFRFGEILQQGHVTTVSIHSSHSSANSVIRRTVFLERLAFRWSLLAKKKGRMKEWREKGDKKKCAPSPHLFRRLPALSFSFWEELDQLWPSARGSSIPTAIFIHHQASLGSLYWGYSALHYIKKEEIEGY